MTARYPVGAYLKQTSAFLGFTPEPILRRVGLSATLVGDKEIYVSPKTYFQIWDAVCAEANRPGLEMDLAMAYAHGPFVPPIFAFSCAETLGLGLARLADFKPLIGPIELIVERSTADLTITLRPTEVGLSISPSMGMFDLLYITECARTFTGTMVTPIKTSLTGFYQTDADILDYLGQSPTVAQDVSLTFAANDADLPLITRSASLWDALEQGFIDQLEERTGAATFTGRVKNALVEALPGGSVLVDDMARRLNMSKRSLQRRLNEEETSFQKLLDEARFEISIRYLKETELSVPEISFLLGFREASSFFRAFQGWTGTTPGEYRTANYEETTPFVEFLK